MEFKNKKNSWLDEDEEWSDLKQRVKRQAAQDAASNKAAQFDGKRARVTKTTSDPEKVEVNIKLSVPKIDRAKLAKRAGPALWLFRKIKVIPNAIKHSSFKQRALAFAVISLVVAGGVGFKIQSNKADQAQVQGAKTDTKDPKAVELTHDPKFDTVLPKGRNITKEQIAYDPQRNFAKYDDTINTLKVSVSQQPLPEAFKTDPSGSVQKLAENFAAKEKLTLNDQDMFYGRSQKGPETLILTKKNILIFITTQQMIGKEALKAYAYNLY